MGWLFGKKKESKLKSRTPMTRKEKLLKLAQNNTFFAVTITCCGCEASSKLINKRFLFDNVPALPLHDCTADKCSCEFQGVVDHRSHSNRRVSTRRKSIRMDDNDRRKKARRKNDASWDKSNI